MNCYNHPSVAAVGICRSCGKGVCFNCVTDLGKGIACRGRCEQDVRDSINLTQRVIKRYPYTEKVTRMARRNRFLPSMFYLAMGVLFGGQALVDFLTNGFDNREIFLGLFGLICLIYGGVSLGIALRLPKP